MSEQVIFEGTVYSVKAMVVSHTAWDVLIEKNGEPHRRITVVSEHMIEVIANHVKNDDVKAVIASRL